MTLPEPDPISTTDVCGIRFEIPAQCHLPAEHDGEHAPDTVARALVTISIASDELDAERREFDRERDTLRARARREIERLRTVSVVVGIMGLVCFATTLVTIWHQTA